jgi:hypothetical protein
MGQSTLGQVWWTVLSQADLENHQPGGRASRRASHAGDSRLVPTASWVSWHRPFTLVRGSRRGVGLSLKDQFNHLSTHTFTQLASP